ncbi:hypothetical protein ZWY2020_011668 [Hordeum vulgare]|nr:hypothetical protein ZWY2020_011668 [Hordeum vulgare]
MADPIVDIDKALIALKKGTQLLKYGRKGKPKFTPFRLSTDESTLIWVSSNQEKSLKLASLVFQRFLLPEKDHLSFSLIYKDGKRSLDLICKDKVETQVWFTCLSALVSPGKHRSQPQHTDEMRSAALSFDCGRESSLSSSSTFTTDSLENKLSSANSKDRSSGEYAYSERTDVSDMQVKSVSSSDIRVSVSSALSTSSHGSGGEDSESFGDVYVWGEVMCDTTSISGSDGNALSPGATTDILVPKPLESNVMLDVSYVACGVKHAALITRQTEVFTWGEECSGRLGHGAGTSIFQPRLLESLSTCNVEIMACGEFHTCAVTATGDLYTWGDGTHNAGLLGHGSTVSHWIPKRVSGPLEGLQVSTVSCGTWHTALITTSGLLYTFGDGTFGALGHGNRETISYPKEVESLKGLRTISVSCGVWHSAAVVEIIMTQSNASSGHMFTVGSSVYGQLGNPNNDGRYARLVEDKVGGGGVVEVACGSYHVAVLTNAGEVYTWGKGANGRLGHGDIADRKVPTLVEALRESYSRNTRPRIPGDTKAERMDTKANRVASSTSSDMIKSLDVKAAKQTKRSDHSPQFPAILQMNDIPFIGSGDLHNAEVQKLKEEVNSLRQQRELQDAELKKSEAKASEAAALAAEEASKSKAAKEVIKSLTAQKWPRLPPGDSDVKPPRTARDSPGGVASPEMGREGQKRYEPVSIHYSQTPTSVTSAWSNGLPPQAHQIGKPGDNTVVPHDNMFEHFNKSRDFPATHQRTNSGMAGYRPRSEDFDRRETERFQINLQGWNTRGSPGSPSNQVESEWIEQFEPGVYLTLVSLHDGTKELKRVRFSRRRFAEHQAESWWSDNHEKVYDKYNVRRTDRISSVLTS